MTEYAIIVFIVAVVGASGFRVFGSKLQGGLNRTQGTLSEQQAGAGGPGGNDSFAAATTAGGGAGGGGGHEANAGFGGARVALKADEGTPFAKFALIALCVIGAGAAFFAAMKGKHAR